MSAPERRLVALTDEVVLRALDALHGRATAYEGGLTPEARALAVAYRDAFDGLACAWERGTEISQSFSR